MFLILFAKSRLEDRRRQPRSRTHGFPLDELNVFRYLSNYRICMNSLFRALDDLTRRKILELLREKDMTAGEIAACFTVSKPTISHHLDLLRQADLILAEKRGQFIVYSINTSVLDDCIAWLIDLKTERKPNETAEKRVAPNRSARRTILRRRPALG
jgi:ArsR family transcriptional regulator, arsenate/arsenite/antimonite-responsive transcriptional repressor